MDITKIRDMIESMSKFNQVEVLRILSRHKSIILNENKYGIHINLTELTEEQIKELHDYVNYVNTQELTLNAVEKQKEFFKTNYFTSTST
jgi:hypothetical protein